MRDLIAEKKPIGDPAKQHLAFVVATDDPAWCRKHLSGLPQKLATDTQDGTVSIHYTVDYFSRVKQNHAHFDLAVLSHCNHSIYDYGSFGFWGAFLANGITVVADIGRHYRNSEMVRRANFKDWHLLQLDLDDYRKKAKKT